MVSFLLEVGTEELPAGFVASAIAQWQEMIPERLAAAHLSYAQLEVFGTPRRLAVLIEDLPAQQPNTVEETKGPPVQIAYKDGVLTAAATGFARKQGVEPADLVTRTTPKGDFLFAIRQVQGQPTPALLQTMAPEWIKDLKGDRLMRWGTGELKFPRPIRWLVSLWGSHILPFELEDLSPDRLSFGHRVLHPEPIVLSQATDYIEAMVSSFVEPRRDHRQAQIETQVQQQAANIEGVASITASLLAEVTDLVEWPTAVLGQFDPAFLTLPAPVIRSVMVTHQRYFAVHPPNQPEQLLPSFITVANGDPAKGHLIAAGNERVIRARLADGQFFYLEDQKVPLADQVTKLGQVTFEESLGSMLAKVARIRQISGLISEQLGFKAEDRDLIDRTAHLCKADLVSQMVYEFPEMQGIMGADYARQGGEPAAVATGIEQHYWPLGAGDRLPQVLTAQVVGLADRLDSLVSLFQLGKIPSGSSDRFALRRAATSVVLILWEAKLPLDLVALLTTWVETGWQETVVALTETKTTPADLLQSLLNFFRQRVQTLLQDDQGIDYDLVQAALGEPGSPLELRSLQALVVTQQRARYLQELRQSGVLEQLYPTVNRTAKLAAQGDLSPDQLDPAAVVSLDQLQDPAEQALYATAQDIYQVSQAAPTDFAALVQALLTAAPTVTAFFEAVLVMDPDPVVRQRRLALLGVLRNNALRLGDFGAVVMTSS